MLEEVVKKAELFTHAIVRPWSARTRTDSISHWGRQKAPKTGGSCRQALSEAAATNKIAASTARSSGRRTPRCGRIAGHGATA